MNLMWFCFYQRSQCYMMLKLLFSNSNNIVFRSVAKRDNPILYTLWNRCSLKKKIHLHTGAALKKQQTGPLANLKDSCLCFIPHLCGNTEVGEPFKEVRVWFKWSDIPHQASRYRFCAYIRKSKSKLTLAKPDLYIVFFFFFLLDHNPTVVCFNCPLPFLAPEENPVVFPALSFRLGSAGEAKLSC